MSADETEKNSVPPDQATPQPAPSPTERPPQPVAKEDASDHSRVDSVAQFIAVATRWIPDERIRADVRVTPKGLFIHKDTLTSVMEGYQAWLHSVAPHVDEPTPARILKRMFNSTEPPLYYLIEPKRALVGHLIEAPVANPKALGLPVYLGSLEDAFTRVHPRDPMVQCIPQLTVIQSAQGISFELSLEKRVVTFTTELVQLCGRIARGNRQLRERLGGEGPWALREVLRLLIEELHQSRWAPTNQRLILPQSVLADRNSECLVHGHLFFPVRQNGLIETIIDREGYNLHAFVRSEALALTRTDGAPRQNGGGGARGATRSQQNVHPRNDGRREAWHGSARNDQRRRDLRRGGSFDGRGGGQSNSLRSGGSGHLSSRSSGNVGRETSMRKIDIGNVGSFVPVASGGRSAGGRSARARGGGDRQRRIRPGIETVGQFRFYGKSYALSTQALVQFVRAVLRSAPHAEHPPVPGAVSSHSSPGRRPAPPQEWRRFSVLDCIKELGEVFLRAESVDAHRVERFVRIDRPRWRGAGPGQFRMRERWIFVVGAGDVIETCADKLAGERELRREGGRSGERASGRATSPVHGERESRPGGGSRSAPPLKS